jgi:hypothetical protein
VSDHKNRRWYVSYGDEFMNEIVCDLEGFDPDTDFIIGANVEDVDENNPQDKKMRQTNLAFIASWELISRLQKHKDRLKFKIFVQDSLGGKIYRWPADVQNKKKGAKITNAAKMIPKKSKQVA